MGILSRIQAIHSVQKIKKGETANLSISQITNLIVNLFDARKNLTKQQYEAVYKLYNELNKCRTKHQVDLQGYIDIAVDIIKRLDVIAPYEKFCGGNELEFSFLMEKIREEKASDNNEKCNAEITSEEILEIEKKPEFIALIKCITSILDNTKNSLTTTDYAYSETIALTSFIVRNDICSSTTNERIAKLYSGVCCDLLLKHLAEHCKEQALDIETLDLFLAQKLNSYLQSKNIAVPTRIQGKIPPFLYLFVCNLMYSHANKKLSTNILFDCNETNDIVFKTMYNETIDYLKEYWTITKPYVIELINTV